MNCIWGSIIFFGLKWVGYLRVTKDVELQGLDGGQMIGAGNIMSCLTKSFAVKD